MDWRKIWPYWGLITLVVAITAWLTSDIGPVGLTALFALSLLWFLAQAPVPCGALTREQGQTCRNNARGLLRGCRYAGRRRLRGIPTSPRLPRKRTRDFQALRRWLDAPYGPST